MITLDVSAPGCGHGPGCGHRDSLVTACEEKADRWWQTDPEQVREAALL